MSMQGDSAREGLTDFICRILVKKIEEHPEAAPILKEIGLEVLAELDAVPSWAREYYRLFRQQ